MLHVERSYQRTDLLEARRKLAEDVVRPIPDTPMEAALNYGAVAIVPIVGVFVQGVGCLWVAAGFRRGAS